MHNGRIVGIVASLLLASAALTAQEKSTVLTTSGSGRITMASVRARISVGVEARARSATVAADSNNRRLTAIVSRLKALNYLDSVRVTAALVRQTTDAQGRFSGYQAYASVEARLLDLTKVATVFDAAILSGATSIGSVRFEADSQDVARRRALEQAFLTARADAEALARAAGAHLGRLIRMSTGGQRGDEFNSYVDEASVSTGASSAEFGNAQAGVISIATDPTGVATTASVTTQWELMR